MSFDCMAYLLFLPLTVLLHWLCPSRFRWMVLLGASYLFYGWQDPKLLALILAVTFVSWLAALMIQAAERPTAKKFWLMLAVVTCLSSLVFFKYFNFLGHCIVALSVLLGGGGRWEPWDIVLPVGISFYTFQAMSYTVDVNRGDLNPRRHFGMYALYISFFPQLVAGPIERAGSLLPQLEKNRQFTWEDIGTGMKLLLDGYFRKIVIADLCAPCVDAVFSAQDPDGAAVFLGTILFSFQIYCDFSGYSKIAAGSARLLGIRLMRNFERPYRASDFRDFWRRWHISLSRWFTDYVYIPLGGSHHGLRRQIMAILMVFLLSGLWHGAEGTFVLWGLYHGILLSGELLLRRTPIRCPVIIRRIGVFTLVSVGWIFFRAESISHGFFLIHRLLSVWDWRSVLDVVSAIDILTAFTAIAALPVLDNRKKSNAAYFWMLAAILLAWFLRLESGGGNSFLYFQF